MTRLGFVSAVTVLIVGAAGCGGDDDSAEDDASAEALPKAEWIKQADVICKEADEEVRAVDEPSSLEDVAASADDVKAIVAEQLAQLRELPPPDEISDDVARMLDLLQQDVDSIDALKEAAEANDQAEFETVAEDASNLRDEANEIADSLGIEECDNQFA